MSFWRFEDIVVEPPPAQRPHPPFWMAAGSPASIRKAAARGFNLMLDQYASPEQIGERMTLYRAEREAHGRPFDRMGVVVARQLYVARDRADAEAALARKAKYTQRTVSVSRSPARKGGSHVLAYAGKSGEHRGARALWNTGARRRSCQRSLRQKTARATPRNPAHTARRLRGRGNHARHYVLASCDPEVA